MLFSRVLLEFGPAYLISQVVLAGLDVSTTEFGSFDNSFCCRTSKFTSPFSLSVCKFVD